MSKTVDERIVSMQFDNAQFEKNVSTSMSTIDKLKKKLKFEDSTKGLDDLNKSVKNVDMSVLSKSVETVSSKFSAMQVVAITALANITNSAVNAGKNLVSSLSVDQIASGWEKYNQKTSSVQTIMNSTGKTIEEVNSYLDQLMWYSDETSYGFTDMTQSLAQMTSAGGDIEKLIPMIEGIANATAFAGKGAAEFQHVIYNLNQSYSKGYIDLTDWKSVDLMGASSKQLKQVLIDTAISLGKLTKEGKTAKGTLVDLSTFNTTLSEQWADTEVMEKGFGKFAELTQAAYEAVSAGKYDTATEAIDDLASKYSDIASTAFKAAQEAKTFSEAIDATKDAVSSGWMKTFEIIFGNYEDAKVLWSELAENLWEVFASGADERNALLSEVLGGNDSKWEELQKKVEATGVSFSDFEKKFKEVCKKNSIDIDALVEKYGSLPKALSSGEIKNIPKLIKETFSEFLNGGLKVSDTANTITSSFEHMQDVVLKVIRGDFGNGADRINAMAEAGENWANAQSIVDYIWERNGHTWEDCTFTLEEMNKVIGELSDEELKNAGYTQEQIDAFRELAKQAAETNTPISELINSFTDKPSGKELLIDSFRNAIKGLLSVIEAIKNAWNEIFPAEDTANGLYKTIEAIHNFSEKLVLSGEKADQVKSIFRGLFAALDMVRMVVGGGLNIAFRILKAVLGVFNIDILEASASIGEFLVKIRDWLKEHDPLTKAIQFLVTNIVKVVTAVKDWVANNETLKNSFKTVKDFILKAVSSVKEWYTQSGGIIGVFKGIGSAISNAYTAVKDWIMSNETLAAAFSKISEFVKKAAESIKEWFNNLKGADGSGKNIIDGLINGLKSGLSTAIEFIKNLGTKIIEAFKNVLGIHSPSKVFFDFGLNIVQGLINAIRTKGLNMAAEAIINFAMGLIDKFKEQLGIHSPSTVFMALGGFIVAGLLIGLKNGFPDVLETIKGFGTSIIDTFKNLNFGKVMAALTAVGTFVLVKSAIDTINKITGVISDITAVSKGVGKLLSGIGSAFDNLGKSLAAKKYKYIGDMILEFAIAVGILAASLFLISKIDPDRLWESVWVLAAIVAVVGALAFALTKLSKGISDVKVDKSGLSFNKQAASIIQIGATILLIAIALKVIADIGPDVDKAEQVMLGIIIALSAMIIIMAKMSKIGNTDNADKLGKMFIELSVAMLLMAVVMKIFAAMKPEDLIKGMAVILGFVGIFTLLALVNRVAGKEVKQVGLMLIEMAAAMVAMVLVIKLISKLDKSEIDKGIDTMAKFTLLFAGMTLVSRIAGKDGAQAGAMLLLMAGAMLILAYVIKIIGKMEPEELAKGLIVIAILSTLFAGLIFVSQWAGPNAIKAGAMLLMAAGALLAVVAILYVISKMDPEGLGRSLFIIAVLEKLFMGLIIASRYAENVDKGVIIALVAGIAVLALALVGLSFIDTDKLMNAVVAITTVMIALALVIASTSYMEGAGKELAVNLLIMVGAIAVLALIIYGLSTLECGSAMESAIALSVLLVAVTASLAILSMIGKAMDLKDMLLGVVGLLAMAVPLLAFVGILALMQNVQNATQNAIALSIMATVLTLLLIPLILVGALIYPALLGVLALTAMAVPLLAFVGVLAVMQNVQNAEQNVNLLIGMMTTIVMLLVILAPIAPLAVLATYAIGTMEVLMVSLGLLAVAVGALVDKFPALEEFLDKGIDILIRLAGGIGEMMGAFIAGVATQVLQILPALGKALSDFMFKAMPFIIGMKLVDEKTLAGVAILSGAIIALTVGELTSAVTNFFTGSSFADLGTQLSAFMKNVTPFIVGLKGIDADAANAAKALAETILVLTAADLVSGIASWITGGESTIADFAKEIGPFGAAIKKFSDNTEGINPENIKAASEAGKALADMASTIPNEGGVVGWFAGENSIAKFGTEIEAFGLNLTQFSKNVEGINPDNIKAASEAGKALAEMASTIPNEGGVVGWFAGENSISKFGTEIEQFGSNLTQFSKNVEGINPDNVEAASKAGKALSEMADTIPNEGGVVGWFAGENSIAKFGEDIEKFGTNIKNFSDNVEGINPDNVKAATKAGKSIAESLALISEKGVKNVDDFNDLLVKFGTAIKDFSTEIQNVSAATLKAKVDNIVKAIEGISAISDTNLKNLTEAFDNATDKISNSLDSVLKAIKDKSSKFESSGKDLIDKLIKGIKSKKDDIKGSIFTGKIDNAIGDVKKKKTDFENAGKDLCQGLINGLKNKDKLQAVYDAAYALGQKAVQGEKDGQKSNSPSKLTYQAGVWFGEGLINGISSMSSDVYDESKVLGNNAVKGLSGAIAKVSDVINSDIDTQPTIRPVLDLSNITSGAGTINGLFDMNPSVGVMANVRSISSSMNSNQNGTTDDVISAINKLNKTLGDASGDTYNINGVTYDDGSNISSAVQTLVRAAKIERRI